jgi:hypothetical protein
MSSRTLQCCHIQSIHTIDLEINPDNMNNHQLCLEKSLSKYRNDLLYAADMVCLATISVYANFSWKSWLPTSCCAIDAYHCVALTNYNLNALNRDASMNPHNAQPHYFLLPAIPSLDGIDCFTGLIPYLSSTNGNTVQLNSSIYDYPH